MKKVAVIFPGYGSQYVGMGKDLYDDYRIMQEFFEEAYNCQNVNFVKLCFASSDQELSQLSNAFQSIFLLNSALFTLLKQMGLDVHMVAGSDIGYFSALFASGSISFPDGLYILNKIASFYETFLNEKNVKIIEIFEANRQEIDDLIKKFSKKTVPLRVIQYKSNDNFLVGGNTDSFEKLEEALKKKEIKFKELNTTPILYSEMIQEVSDQIRLYLEKVDIKEAQIPFKNPSAQTLSLAHELKGDVVEHFIRPYDFHSIMDDLKDFDVIIEIGARSKLAELAKKYYPEKEILSFNNKSDIPLIKEFLGENTKELERVSE